MINEYYLDRLEFAKIQEFMDKHKHSNVFILGYSGGSGIGINIYVTCGHCYEKLDATNYDSW